MAKRTLIMIGPALLIVIGAGLVWYFTRPPDLPAPPTFETVGTFDELQNRLAQRARQRLGTADDFQVYPSDIPYGLGTVIRETGRGIPVSRRACVPSAPPPIESLSGLFPNYRMASRVAGGIGVYSDVLRHLAGANVEINEDASVSLSFADLGAQILADDDLHAMAQNAACRNAIAGAQVLLVRGYIIGRRQFSVQANRSANARANLKVGNLVVTPGAGQSIEIRDERSFPFLQIVSRITLTPDRQSVALVAPPVSPAIGSGRIYVQGDRTDRSGNPARVVATLRTARLNVEPTVERMESSRVPMRPQVRYFNESDRLRAEGVVDLLSPILPDLRAVQIGLPAPRGQIEVWTSRVQGQENQAPETRR